MRRNTLLWLAMGFVLGACGDDGKGVVDAVDTFETSYDLYEVEAFVPDAIAETTAPDTTAPDTTAPDTTVPDTTPETLTPDTTPETVADTAPETVPDTTPETVEETTPEIIEDTIPETSPEIIEDTTPETTPETIAETTPETEVTQPAEVLAEGSFERWVDGSPVGWVGSATSLSSDGIIEDTDLAHDGVRAAQIVNESSTHKRFSSAPSFWPDGRYTCTYWVRGSGDIRNAFYNGSYSSYSSYTTINQGDWRELSYTFNVNGDAPALELIFSVKSTSIFGLRLDDVACARISEACDALACESWQTCRNDRPSCETAAGFCADANDCAAWETCGAAHRCELAAGFCQNASDCAAPTPVCETASHICVAGDLCANANCNEWEACNATTGACDVAPGRCESLADCDQALPACQLSNHTCVPVDAAVNVVPNGGFEDWDDYSLGGAATYELPDFWYGLADGGSYFPETEIAPTKVVRYTTSTHSGDAACQLVEPGQPADRFTTEPFPVTPAAAYACSYWVRGHGTYRQRAYCGQWAPDTTYTAIDSAEWQQVTFDMSGSASRCVLVFYASNTVADRDHIQLDDVVCIKK